jgi:hypothetical protein
MVLLESVTLTKRTPFMAPTRFSTVSALAWMEIFAIENTLVITAMLSPYPYHSIPKNGGVKGRKRAAACFLPM